MIAHMRFRRGLPATALAASLTIIWTQEAHASQTIVIPVSQRAYATSHNINCPTTDSFVAAGDPSPAATGADESAQDRWMRYFLNEFRLQITYTPA